MIYNHILVYPGVSYNVLKQIFELTDGGLRYHLDYLERTEKINSGVERGNRCYYPNHHPVNLPNHSSEFSESHQLNPQQERILQTIKLNPGINQKELIHRTRLTRSQIAKYISKLLNLKLVKKISTGGFTYYEYIPDEELKFKIMRRLVIKLLKDEITEEKFIELKRKLED